ncbi:MAG: L-alanine exporter AlaE [Deltaproteobacteria bacterium]|nr:L-alanine exporter AlaE [Deltaproteobacteria bacterium]
MRRLAADVFAMVTFSTALAMMIEIGIAELTLLQSAQARLLAVPVNLATGRPYGIFREWWFRRLGVSTSRRVQTALADTAAFVLFQIPLYAGVLALSGAKPMQIAVACASMSLIFALAGRPYGLYLDGCRRALGVECSTPGHGAVQGESRQ